MDRRRTAATYRKMPSARLRWLRQIRFQMSGRLVGSRDSAWATSLHDAAFRRRGCAGRSGQLGSTQKHGAVAARLTAAPVAAWPDRTRGPVGGAIYKKHRPAD